MRLPRTSTCKGVIRGTPLRDDPATVYDKTVNQNDTFAPQPREFLRPGPPIDFDRASGTELRLTTWAPSPCSVQDQATSSVGDAAYQIPMSSTNAPLSARFLGGPRTDGPRTFPPKPPCPKIALPRRLLQQARAPEAALSPALGVACPAGQRQRLHPALKGKS
ncbi:hypothetical protein HPB50_002798 [Hyalomma asiaticum]|uniref:Uncharacterized protein n=1 Tax=Hyalomma asiaticum TaxID=266040 RepID=A0ACB7S4D8_HYAAI|nr:hypothetical protein HPB50_002798 [Hyalomma asiaticum]